MLPPRPKLGSKREESEIVAKMDRAIQILDLGLPSEDGFRVLKQVKTAATIATIVLSGRSAIGNKERALQHFHFWCLQSDGTQRGFSSRKAALRCPVLFRVEVKML